MKILVTGAHGQLGRELHNILESTHPGLSVYTDIDTLDITDAQKVKSFIEQGAFSHIVNCAGYTNVDKAESEEGLCNKINSDAVRNIAMAASQTGIKVLHVSTDYVFDGKSYKPYRESDKVNPVSAYGTAKRKGEMVLLSMCPDAIIIRTAWLYSPFGHNFVKTMIRLGKERKTIGVVCDQIGSPTYALDLAEVISGILFARQWIPGIYHFTDEGVCSWYDFTKAIHQKAGITGCTVNPILTEDYPTPATRPHYSVLDKTFIKKIYGITIPYWADSLSRCIDRINNGEE